MREQYQTQISERLDKVLAPRDAGRMSVTPEFPVKVMLELSNICNHACSFCAIPKMTRKKKQMPNDTVRRVVQEAYDLGSREIGLFSGAEPFASPNLEETIKLAKDTGYEYIYMSTNGTIPTKERLQKAFDNGLDSIKFSVNGGTREAYKRVHKRDHFERVVDNIKFIGKYRNDKGLKTYIGISFVEFEENEGTLDNLKELLGDFVDEFLIYEAANGSGQMFGYATIPVSVPCSLPFEVVYITCEGYIRACCNDYQNYLAIEDLAEMSLKDAFYSQRFQALRQGHLDGDPAGTLCHNCLFNKKDPVKPVNEALGVRVDADWFDSSFDK